MNKVFDTLPKKIFLFGSLILISILTIVTCLLPTNYTVTGPGGLVEVENKIVIEEMELSGSINTVYVRSIDRPNYFAKLIYSLLPRYEVDKLSNSSSQLSNNELREISRISYETGITNSLIASFLASDKEVEFELASLIVDYIDKTKKITNLEIGDQIVKINNQSFETLDEFKELIKEDDDDYIEFETVDGDQKYAKILDSKLFVLFEENYEILSSEKDFEVITDTGFGGSGGLLQSLGLYMEIVGEDLTKGRKIAGTGTINVDGEVGIIGGIKQKIYTAVDNDVDVFLCPVDNYEEALEAYEDVDTDMKLFKVSTLEEAISILNE